MTRLLLALALCLATVPAAVAYGEEAPPDEPICAAERDGCEAEDGEEERACAAEGDRCEAEDGEEEPAGEGDPEACEPAGDEPGGDRPGDDGGADEEPIDDEDGDVDGDEEVAAPLAEAESAPAAPGYRDFCEAPVFDHGFLRRTWRLSGTTEGFEDGVLILTVASIARVPRRFRTQAELLNDLEVAVVVGRGTRISAARRARGARRRGGRRVSPEVLSDARRVRVQGKLLAPSRWRRDADGLRIPTLRATKIVVVR